MQNNNFRYDINGLRAYAVILVVLFHFGITGFAAGFIGVDIFFVISGFLMTSIVVRGLEKRKFSILEFYLSRGIRIVPALFVVCMVLLILGWFLILPLDYKALAKHVLASINFISNIIYWNESGYFEVSSHNKALLHTWSLSVEWQFYLLFPIVVTLLYKLKPSRQFLLIFMGLGVIISFVLSIFIASRSPSAGFFWLPTRAWQLLFGGLIFFIQNEKVLYKKSLEIVGFFFILLSCYLFSSNTMWPSYNALLPVLGTFFILLANQQDSIFTRNKFFQWFGNTSYSIYLWHWPIVFFLNYFYKNDDNLFIILGITLSIFLGWLSYTFIENPTRKKLSNLSKFKAYVFWILSVTILSAMSLTIFKLDGIKGRFSNDINNISNFYGDKDPRIEECLLFDMKENLFRKCTYGSGRTSLIIIGDSHANSMLNGITKSLPLGQSLDTFTVPGCNTILGLKRVDNNSKCGERVEEIINVINKKYSRDIPILVINKMDTIFSNKDDDPKAYVTKPSDKFDDHYNSQMKTAYINTLGRLAKNHIVYVTRAIPQPKIDIPNYYSKMKEYNLNSDKLKMSLKDYQYENEKSWEAQNLASQKFGIRIIDVSKLFCDSNYCYFVKNGKPLFYDHTHMGWTASEMLVPIFKKEIFRNN